jgi:hypothetical protein
LASPRPRTHHIEKPSGNQKGFAAFAAGLDNFAGSGEATVHSGPYGTLPILIFSEAQLLEGETAAMGSV